MFTPLGKHFFILHASAQMSLVTLEILHLMMGFLSSHQASGSHEVPCSLVTTLHLESSWKMSVC